MKHAYIEEHVMERMGLEPQVRPGLIHARMVPIVRHALVRLGEIRDGGDVIHQGTAFGDLANDTEIRADRELGNYFREAFAGAVFGARRITIEGFREDLRPAHGPPHDRGLWYCSDPLDGSLNRKLLPGPHGLPHTACVTVLRTSEGATFNDVIAAAIIDLRNGDLWSGFSGGVSSPSGEQACIRNTFFNGRPLSIHNDWSALQKIELDLGSQIVFGETYYPGNRERLAQAFTGMKGSLRSLGSTAYELALVASGVASAFICDQQKQHELGAGWLLVQGAGGVAVDWDGNDLGPRAFDFNTQTPCVLAWNRRIADQILKLLHAT